MLREEEEYRPYYWNNRGVRVDGSVENGTFLELFPTSLSTSVDPSSGHLSNVYIYVSIFLSLLAFLLLLLIIALQRLKNIISSSSSYPEYPSRSSEELD
ncbi:hypothetical protein A6R68_05253, partial [Neotoma lepida]